MGKTSNKDINSCAMNSLDHLTDAEIENGMKFYSEVLRYRARFPKQYNRNLPDKEIAELQRRGDIFLKLWDTHHSKDMKVVFEIGIHIYPTVIGQIVIDINFDNSEDFENHYDILNEAIKQNAAVRNSIKRLQKAYEELFKYATKISKRFKIDVGAILVEAGLNDKVFTSNFGIIDARDLIK